MIIDKLGDIIWMIDGLFLKIFVVHIIDVTLEDNWCRDNSCI